MRQRCRVCSTVARAAERAAIVRGGQLGLSLHHATRALQEARSPRWSLSGPLPCPARAILPLFCVCAASATSGRLLLVFFGYLGALAGTLTLALTRQAAGVPIGPSSPLLCHFQCPCKELWRGSGAPLAQSP